MNPEDETDFELERRQGEDVEDWELRVKEIKLLREYYNEKKKSDQEMEVLEEQIREIRAKQADRSYSAILRNNMFKSIEELVKKNYS